MSSFASLYRLVSFHLDQLTGDGEPHVRAFVNRRGYKTTVEGLSERFNKEYWNYAKLISGILRYRMPLNNVIKLVGSLQLENENINTWANGVARALKKYTTGEDDLSDDLKDDLRNAE